jgi:hypothetical protein
MKMQETIAKDARRRRIARRVGAAGTALAAVLALGACDAQGGGNVGAFVDDVDPVGEYTGEATFGFNFNCEEGIKGEMTYRDDPSEVEVPVVGGGTVLTPFPEIRLHGTVDKVLLLEEPLPVTPDDPVNTKPATSCPEVAQAPGALFQGSYRSQDTTLLGSGTQPSRFTVQVLDMGEASARAKSFNGDMFVIELEGGPYNGYTRAGNVEDGNIQTS